MIIVARAKAGNRGRNRNFGDLPYSPGPSSCSFLPTQVPQCGLLKCSKVKEGLSHFYISGLLKITTQHTTKRMLF